MKAMPATTNANKIPPTTAAIRLPIAAFIGRSTFFINAGFSKIEVVNGIPPVCKFPVGFVGPSGGIGWTR